MDGSAPGEPELDLASCDREPIHVPGSIQPHGLMLVFDAGSLAATHAAGDIESRLGIVAWAGRSAADLFGADLARRIAGIGSAEGSTGLDQIEIASGEVVDVTAFRTGRHIVVELEPAGSPGSRPSVVLDEIAAAGTAFERSAGLKGLCERAAAEFRRLTGFDRVLIYRFLDDDAGTVLAEDRDPALSSFLHHHFPASDIPRQARALYVRNRIRVIPDIGYVPAPLRAAAAPGEVVDLSDSALRSVSPIHVQYLRNMGVGASASVSIIRERALWGLVACHNLTPRIVPYDTRVVCRTLAGSLARQIGAKEEAETYRERIKLRSLEDEVVARLSRTEAPRDALKFAMGGLRETLGADGLAVVAGSDLWQDGACPPAADIRSLAGWAAPQAARQTLATDHLSALLPAAALHTEVASGLVAITVSIEEPIVVLWFRAEQVQVVKWAGNPHKPALPGAGETLSPRASFAEWSETVRGRSRPWSAPEIEAAGRLRDILLGIRQQRRLRDLNDRLTESLADKELLLRRQEMLVKEMNHRVQNSLTLVTSFLRMQARGSGSEDLRGNLEDAQRRVGAVALVHRRLYRADQVETIDLSRYLEELCGEMIGSLGAEWSEQITVDLAPISIATDRAVPLGLILTELVINANKYAYGGAAGPVEITLEQKRRDLRLIVADRGRGRAEAGSGFGSRMITALVGQLSGELDYADNGPGVRAVLTAPIASEARAEGG